VNGAHETINRFACNFTNFTLCLQCFDAVGWVAGRASGLEKTELWGAGVVICLQQGADLHMAQRMPLPLTISCFSKIQIGFTFLVLAHMGKGKSKVFPYSLPSVGPGADPGVQAVSPQVT